MTVELAIVDLSDEPVEEPNLAPAEYAAHAFPVSSSSLKPKEKDFDFEDGVEGLDGATDEDVAAAECSIPEILILAAIRLLRLSDSEPWTTESWKVICR